MTKEISQENRQWYDIGLLSNLNLSHKHLNSKGVYIWTNEVGEKKRIIYVGTANSVDGFQKRMGTHIGDILIGKETVYKFSEDPYNVLTKDIYQIEELIRKKMFWYCNNNVYHQIQDWVSVLALEFLKSTRVWICPLKVSETSRKVSYCIESQILNKIVTDKKITYCSKTLSNSWVGKQSRTIENAQECSFSFDKNYLPEIFEEDLKYFDLDFR